MSYQFLTKLDWFATLFPRIPVPIQKQIEKSVEMYCRQNNINLYQIISTTAVFLAGVIGQQRPETEDEAAVLVNLNMK